MPKIAVKGTRGADIITVSDEGVTVNGIPKQYTAAQIAEGFSISGAAGNDTITGGVGPDNLNGGAGADTLTGGGGFDSLLGGDGNDVLSDAPMGAAFDGGRGSDTINVSSASQGVFIDLGSGFIDDDIIVTVFPDGRSSFDAWQDGVYSLTSIENATGSNFNDVLWGSSGANILKGRGGVDQLVGQGGDDRLFGGAGNDYLYGGSGNDQLTGEAGRDYFLLASGSAAGSGDGRDTILDYKPGEDVLVFQWSQHDLVWSTTTVNGQLSLAGTYDDGRGVIVLVGITDSDQVTIVHSVENWI